MLKATRNQLRKYASIALLAMLLRILVPAGFMPSALADGWYLKLCPDGISASTMMALLGQQDHGHYHGHGMESGDSSEQSFDQCDLGSGFASAAVSQIANIALEIFIATLVAGILLSATLPRRPRLYLVRAPPLTPVR